MFLDEPFKITDCIISFSFGYNLALYSIGCQKLPGISNRIMAGIVKEISVDGTPVITQWEIAESNELENNPNITLNIKEHQTSGKYLDTYEVARQAAEFMRKQGWIRAWIVAHPAHLWRCKKVLEKMGITVIEPPSLVGIDTNILFNPHSAQWWTHNPFFWWIREIPTIAFYWFKGWI